MKINTYHKILAENIRGFRLKKGFSQEKLAIRAKMTSEHLSMIERRRANPSADIIFRISEALGIEPAKLLTPEAYKKS